MHIIQCIGLEAIDAFLPLSASRDSLNFRPSVEGLKGLEWQGGKGTKPNKSKIMGEEKTYNSRDSLVVTHLTTNLPACGLSTAERTGSPVLHTLWSYVLHSSFP